MKFVEVVTGVGLIFTLSLYTLKAMSEGSFPNNRQLIKTSLADLRKATTPLFKNSTCLGVLTTASGNAGVLNLMVSP